MRLLILAILLMFWVLIPATALCEDEARAPTPQEIRKWTQAIRRATHLMSDHRLLERVKGTRILTGLPAKAEPLIIERLPQMRWRPRFLTLEVLVARKSVAAAALIIKEAQSSPSWSHSRLIRMLQRAIDGWETLKNQPQLEAFRLMFIEAEVRDYHLFCLKIYGDGYFRAMFDKLWRYGKPAFLLMVQIAQGEVQTVQHYDPADGRELASLALIDWPHPAEEKKTILFELTVEIVGRPRYIAGDSTVRKNVQYTLHRLGDEQINVSLGIRMRRKMAEKYCREGRLSAAVFEWSALAEQYLTLRNTAEALDCLQQCILAFVRGGMPDRRRSTAALAWYQIACLHSLEGKPDKAVAALRQAIEFRYTNFDWMWLDRDLENTWSTEEFKKWISDLRSQEVWKHHIPQREAGTLPERD